MDLGSGGEGQVSCPPHPPGRHRAQAELRVLGSGVVASCLFYTWECLYVGSTLPFHPI